MLSIATCSYLHVLLIPPDCCHFSAFHHRNAAHMYLTSSLLLTGYCSPLTSVTASHLHHMAAAHWLLHYSCHTLLLPTLLLHVLPYCYVSPSQLPHLNVTTSHLHVVLLRHTYHTSQLHLTIYLSCATPKPPAEAGASEDTPKSRQVGAARSNRL